MPLSGTFATMALQELLQWLGDSRRSGLLTVELELEERCLLFEEGRIAGYGSDDPLARDIGRLCLLRGLVTEPQLLQVAALQQKSGMPLGDVLVAEGLVPAERLERAIRDHVEETVLGLFLWPDGRFTFMSASEAAAHERAMGDWMPPEYHLSEPIAAHELLLEGMRRQDEWKRISELLHDDDLIIRALAPHPSFPILEEIAAHPTPPALGDLLAERGDGRYQLCEQLFRAHALELIAVEPGPPHEPIQTARGTTTVEHLLRGAQALLAEGQHDEAAALLHSAVQLDAWSTEARSLLRQTERAALVSLREELPHDRIPRISATPARVASLTLGPRERKLLAHVNGRWDVAVLGLASGLGELETLRTLRRLIRAEVISLD